MKADAHRDHVQQLDEFQALLKSTVDLADQFSDDTSEWLLIEHRVQTVKESFDVLFARTNREHRELKVYFINFNIHILVLNFLRLIYLKLKI